MFLVLSTPVFQASHKRASFDSVFRYNACSLTSNLLKGTHGEKTAEEKVEKISGNRNMACL